jgi:hypothetical protein
MSSVVREEVHQQPFPDNPMVTVTEQPINTAGPGPFSVYAPGLSFEGLKGMVYLFNTIPAGKVFEIKSGESWTAKGQLPEGTATKKRTVKNFFGVVTDEHLAREIPAETTLNALLSDRSLTSLGLTQIQVFNQIDANVKIINQLICPEEIPNRTFPRDPKLHKIVDQEGMLKLRAIWLEQAVEAIESNRILEDIRRYTDDKPYLLEVWKDAILQTLLPANNTFFAIATVGIAAIEERIRSGQQTQYDPYALNLMWLLGRKPERTALSRTLDHASKSGIGSEEIKSIVEAVLTANNATTQQASTSSIQKMQCPDCGEPLNTIAGGPPRKCRFCGYEFYQTSPVVSQTQPETIEIFTAPEEELLPPPPAQEMEDLATSILANRK